MDFDSQIIQAESQPDDEKNQESSIAAQEIINLVPEEYREKARNALMIIRQESFAGPIPPPQVLQGYETILPGSADRIIKMAENQQQHRINIEDKAVSGQVGNTRRGQVFAFIVFILCVLVGLVFAYLDMKVFAGIFLTGTMVTVVALFIGGKEKVNTDLKRKSLDQEK